MTVAALSALWFDDQTVEVSWTSDLSDPTFYIWRDGDFVTATGALSQQFRVVPGEYLLLDVFDNAATEPEYAAPGRVHICWLAVSGSVSYLVQEQVGAYWVDRESVPDNGQGFFRFLTRYLADATTTNFRVLPVDAAGNQATSTPFQVIQVRHPEVPDVTYTYDSSDGKVTINNRFAEDGTVAETQEVYTATGSGALDETLSSAGTKRKLLEVRVTLTDAATEDMSGVKILLNPPAALTFDVPLFEANAEQATALASVDAFLDRFLQPVAVGSDQDVQITWTNSGAATWELQITYLNGVD